MEVQSQITDCHQVDHKTDCWETDFYIVLGGAALFALQRQWCIKSCALRTLIFRDTVYAQLQKGQQLPAAEVYKNQSPMVGGESRLATSSDLLKKVSLSICLCQVKDVW